MRAVIQRVLAADVSVEGHVLSSIERGLLVLLGIAQGDDRHHLNYVADKIAGLRIFDDPDGRMNLSVAETGGSILLVSQFTLLADCRRGRRPSFSESMATENARPIYEQMVTALREKNIPVATGAFGKHMHVSLRNDGPVTLVVDSRDKYGA